ncbi:CPBP family intramembrane glutamic endopeptidase [Amycolatopsis jiangsuensis]|uniref:Membrane protease YdiL (CAAX protease family) n=1 Tax=Amycolatopsis jiangsuensis TaxID=1181879 RepID=A0A840J7T3_9PSEU|nr:type II CAAX endopeptidase family protein [Amycolatopsis jiangsuensis]MBB4689514.1 membrane protease YdiL (CAAX protease family) [Amycolatopsis jiangsuensis]
MTTNAPNEDRRDRRSPAAPRNNVLCRRPLLSFFVLTITLSWLAWVPYVLSRNGLGVWHFTFPGEALGSQLLGVLPGAYLGPIASALIVTAATEGRAGLRVWRRRMTNFRVRWYWYLVVLLAVPAALTLGTVVLSGQAPLVPPATVLAAFLPGLVLQMVTTGLAEEPGWREFAMPRMQRRLGPVAATLAVGVIWGAWHLPLFLTDWGGGPARSLVEPVEFLVTVVAFSFVMTWVFNRSAGSMPLVMLVHTSVNNFVSVAWASMFPNVAPDVTTHAFLLTSAVAAVLVLALTRGRLGVPRRDRDDLSLIRVDDGCPGDDRLFGADPLARGK